MAIKQKSKSLKSRGNNLSDTFVQLNVLNGKDIVDAKFPTFTDQLATIGHRPLQVKPVEIFQLNIGKLCNETCAHCHVDAGPDRREENMDRATLERCLEIIAEALAGLDAGLEHVVRTRMYVTDISRWEPIARVHGEVFADIRPATAMVEVKGLVDPEMLVEIEAVAIVG